MALTAGREPQTGDGARVDLGEEAAEFDADSDAFRGSGIGAPVEGSCSAPGGACGCSCSPPVVAPEGPRPRMGGVEGAARPSVGEPVTEPLPPPPPPPFPPASLPLAGRPVLQRGELAGSMPYYYRVASALST